MLERLLIGRLGHTPIRAEDSTGRVEAVLRPHNVNRRCLANLERQILFPWVGKAERPAMAHAR